MKFTFQGRNGKNFLRGQSHFPDFFPGVNFFSRQKFFILVDPKQISVVLKSGNLKKKYKKKEVRLLSFWNFPLPFWNFPLPFSISYLPLTIFLLFFFHFTPLPLFSLVRQQKFPGQKSLRGHSAPRLLRHCYSQVDRDVDLEEVAYRWNFFLFFLPFQILQHILTWNLPVFWLCLLIGRCIFS